MSSHPSSRRPTATARSRRLALAAAAASAAAALAPAAADAAGATAVVELRDRGGLQAFARSVSDPASPSYRHYRSIEQLRKRFGASRRTTARATGFLRARGLRVTVAPSGTFLTAHGPAATLRTAFGADAAATAGRAAAATPAALPVPAALRGAVRSAELLPGAAAASTAAAQTSARRAVRRAARRIRPIPEFTPTDLYNGLSPRRLARR